MLVQFGCPLRWVYKIECAHTTTQKIAQLIRCRIIVIPTRLPETPGGGRATEMLRSAFGAGGSARASETTAVLSLCCDTCLRARTHSLKSAVQKTLFAASFRCAPVEKFTKSQNSANGTVQIEKWSFTTSLGRSASRLIWIAAIASHVCCVWLSHSLCLSQTDWIFIFELENACSWQHWHFGNCNSLINSCSYICEISFYFCQLHSQHWELLLSWKSWKVSSLVYL